MKLVYRFTVDTEKGSGPLPRGGRITSASFRMGTTRAERFRIMANYTAARIMQLVR